MVRLIAIVAACALAQFASTLSAATPALLELKVEKKTFLGKVVAKNDRMCWLMSQDGALHRIQTDKVSSFREVSPQFRSWSTTAVRDQLRRELGTGFEVAGTRHYIACAATAQKARDYAEILENTYRAFHTYFSVRGFKISEPEFPLIAIIFPDRAAFTKYAQAEKVAVNSTLKGYYLSASNRVALFESASTTPASARQAISGSIEASLQDTLVHEATHQVAFNVGLHTRVGTNPRWVVEGLATVFEAPGIRNSNASQSASSRINPDRLVWFGNFNKNRRKAKSLESFIADDEMFISASLDAYSQAWALSFFLIETRPGPYAKYLKSIAQRDPLRNYGPEERVADFKKAFGDNLPLLEAEFLRFISGVR